MPLNHSQSLAKPCRVVFLGAPSTGKSWLVSGCLGRPAPCQYEPTGDDLYLHETGCTCGKGRLSLEVVDTGGEPEYPAMREQLIGTANVFVITFAMNDEASFWEAKQIYREIRSSRRLATNTSSNRNPVKNRGYSEAANVVLVGNKSDALSVEREAPLAARLSVRARKTAADWACPYVETSARNSTGITDLLDAALPFVCRSCQGHDAKRRRLTGKGWWRLSTEEQLSLKEEHVSQGKVKSSRSRKHTPIAF